MAGKSREDQAFALIEKIRALDGPLSEIESELRHQLAPISTAKIEEASARYWEVLAVCNAAVKLRVLVRNNVSYIETLGLLALCRYSFELVVWLKHLEKDARFSLLLARQALKGQLDHFQTVAMHLQREMALYQRLAAEESSAHSVILKEYREANSSSSQIGDQLRTASGDVDAILADNFALYAEEVIWNGYGFQAHLIAERSLPASIVAEQHARAKLDEFDARWGAVSEGLGVKIWKWKQRAAFVGMEHEYEFLYSFTSRLLHATPASF